MSESIRQSSKNQAVHAGTGGKQQYHGPLRIELNTARWAHLRAPPGWSRFFFCWRSVRTRKRYDPGPRSRKSGMVVFWELPIPRTWQVGCHLRFLQLQHTPALPLYECFLLRLFHAGTSPRDSTQLALETGRGLSTFFSSAAALELSPPLFDRTHGAQLVQVPPHSALDPHRPLLWAQRHRGLVRLGVVDALPGRSHWGQVQQGCEANTWGTSSGTPPC